MDKRCLFCKYLGYSTEGEKVTPAHFYKNGAVFLTVQLCRVHDRELFQFGQYKFLKSYQGIGADFLEVDEDFRILKQLYKLLEEYEYKEKSWLARRVS